MIKQRAFNSILLTGLLSFAGISYPGFCQDNAPNFYSTVQEHFSKWDKNQDGTLGPEEIVAFFQNPNCKGNAAAAIAVLQLIETGHMVKNEALEGFTSNDVSKMQTEPGHKKYQSQFESFIKRIQNRPHVLYTHNVPQINDVVQGNANDCYFLSVVASLSHQRPNALMKMIEQNDDGSYSVHYFGEDPVRIACITDAEASAYTTTDDGIWLPVLLKAYGKVQLKKKWDNAKDTPMHEDPLEAASRHGGNCKISIRVFSGHAADSRKPKEIEADLRKQLVKALNEHRIVVCGIPGHAMAVMGYDKDSDQVQIWNPWGTTNFKELGLKMDHGFFALPISEFVEKCNNIMFELAEDAPPEQPTQGNKRGGGNKRG